MCLDDGQVFLVDIFAFFDRQCFLDQCVSVRKKLLQGLRVWGVVPVSCAFDRLFSLQESIVDQDIPPGAHRPAQRPQQILKFETAFLGHTPFCGLLPRLLQEHLTGIDPHGAKAQRMGHGHGHGPLAASQV
jgi:hypothetical protein